MGFFFKDNKPEAKEKISGKIQAKQPQSIISPMVTPVDTSITVDKDYNAQIDKLMEDNNQSGFDYLEFSKSINNSMPLTEQQKYELTAQMMTSMGVSPADIINSASIYLNKIDEYVDTFSRALSHSKEEEISKKQEVITLKQELIKKLTLQIQEESVNIQKLTTDVGTSNNKLKAHENAFNNAVNNRKALINQHINNIKTYLQNGKPT